MKTELVKLSQIRVNGANPRIIKDDKFAKLVNSILDFPKMLELRPIVVDDTLVCLGGNMRYRALTFIAEMPIDDLKSRLCDIRGFQKKTEAEKEALVEHWERWQDNPTAPIIRAADLSDEEQKEFIIKDNVGYGEWDYDMLANDWEAEDLEDWGLDVWQSDNNDGGDSAGESSKPANGSLADRFVIPPFSILDTRKGYWQARKKVWRELIGDMGESRNDTLITSPEIKYKDIYQKTREHRESLGLSFKEYLDKYVPEEVKEREAAKVLSAGVSLLDPVMAELICSWFGLKNARRSTVSLAIAYSDMYRPISAMNLPASNSGRNRLNSTMNGWRVWPPATSAMTGKTSGNTLSRTVWICCLAVRRTMTSKNIPTSKTMRPIREHTRSSLRF